MSIGYGTNYNADYEREYRMRRLLMEREEDKDKYFGKIIGVPIGSTIHYKSNKLFIGDTIILDVTMLGFNKTHTYYFITKSKGLIKDEKGQITVLGQPILITSNLPIDIRTEEEKREPTLIVNANDSVGAIDVSNLSFKLEIPMSKKKFRSKFTFDGVKENIYRSKISWYNLPATRREILSKINDDEVLKQIQKNKVRLLEEFKGALEYKKFEALGAYKNTLKSQQIHSLMEINHQKGGTIGVSSSGATVSAKLAGSNKIDSEFIYRNSTIQEELDGSINYDVGRSETKGFIQLTGSCKMKLMVTNHIDQEGSTTLKSP